MKKLFVGLTVIIVVLFTGCGSKPEKELLVKLENKHLKNWEMVPFLKTIDFEIQNENELEDGSYFIQGFPIIKVEEPFYREFLFEKNTTSNRFKRAVVKFEHLKDYSDGKINSTKLILKLDDENPWQKDYIKPRGILRKGDEFKGMQRTYIFEENDKGWVLKRD